MKEKIGASPLDGFGGMIDSLNSTIGAETIENKPDEDDVLDFSTKPEDDTSDDGKKDKKVKDDKNSINDVNDDTNESDKIDTKLVDKKNVDIEDEDNKDDDEDETTEEDLDVDPGEAKGISDFFDAFSEKLGWEVDDENKPDTVEGLIDYMKDLIDENSTPEYSSDEVKKLDEYVKNGGNFEDYYKASASSVDYGKLNLEDESNLKTVIRDYLKKNGYSDALITKKIDRYEEAGVLEDEATDDIELLKDIQEKEKQLILAQQENSRKQLIEQLLQFYNSIVESVNDLSEIQGIKIPKDDKKKLLDYTLKQDANGLTLYLKDYNGKDGKDLSKNFIQTAYFLMRGDSLLKSAKSSGETSAVNKLKRTLKNSSSSNRSKQSMDNSSATPVWKAATNLFGSK